MTRLSHFVSTSKVLLIGSLLLHQSHLTNAVSLSDFTPEASNLTAGCEAVYTAQIPGCTAIDFQSPTTTQATCSSSCIEALVNTNSLVYNACSSDPQNNVQLIAAFLKGAGIQDLCPNVVVTTLIAGNIVAQTTTLSTTSSGKVTATVTAASDGSVVGASVSSTTTTSVVTSSSLSGMTMGSQVMVGTSILVLPSSVSGSMSDGIIVDTRTPSVPLSTHHVSTTTSATTTTTSISTSSHVVTTASPETRNTASSLNTVTSTSTTTISRTTSTSGIASSSTSCASAEHGGSPLDYCTTNGASSVQITDRAAVALIVGMGALLFLV